MKQTADGNNFDLLLRAIYSVQLSIDKQIKAFFC